MYFIFSTKCKLSLLMSPLNYENKFWTSECFVSVPSLTDSCSIVVHKTSLLHTPWSWRTIYTRHVRSCHVQGLRQASAPLLLSCCFSRGVIVRNTSHCMHLQYTTLTWLLVVGLADSGGQRWTSSWYPRLRDKRVKSSNVVAEREEYCRWHGGADGTSGTDTASFEGYATASRSCAEGHSTTRGHTNGWQTIPRSLVNTRTGQNGHSNSQHTWDPRIPSWLKHCVWLRWRKTRSQSRKWWN